MANQYFVEVSDLYGKKVTVEVSYEVWELFDAERRAKECERNEYRRHGDDRGLEDYILAQHSNAVSDTLEDFYFRREQLRAVYEVLKTCTPAQQERFYLNRICGYTLREIAAMQGCDESAVRRSVGQVQKKLNFLR